MSDTYVDRIADIIAQHELSYNQGTCRCQRWELGITHATHVAQMIARELAVEERWVPVAESGERWAPRSRDEAAQASTEWPAGGVYPGSDDPYDGIVRVEHEVRWATDWFLVEEVNR